MDSNDNQEKLAKIRDKRKRKNKLKTIKSKNKIKDEILKKNIPNNKHEANLMNKKKCKKRSQGLSIEKMKLKSMFKREKLNMYKRFKRRKKKLLDEQSKKQEDFVDYEGMIKLQEKIYRHDREEFQRKKVIYKAEIKTANAVRSNVPYNILLRQEGHLRKLRETNEKKNEEFQKEVFEERSRIIQRTQLSHVRRLELEEKAWQNTQRDFALQRAEERAKTAELMVLLEEVCGHPAEETVQLGNDCGLEDILSSEEECDMENINS